MRLWVALLVCVLVRSCVAVPSVLNLVMIDEPNAVCNDGTNAGYYFKAGDPDRWIIHFQGGGWCYDEPSCASRYKTSQRLMSSTPWTSTYTVAGLFDSNETINPDFYNATYVYLPYCSSDSFSANRSASNATFGWEFRGKVILSSIVQLLLPHGLATAQTVLLSGCSAGGAAVVANVDYVASLLPPLPGRNFRGHPDAGWFMYAWPYAPVNPDMQGIFEIGVPLWGGMANEKCMAALGSNSSLCYMGQFALPYIETPILVFQETEDFVQLAINGVSYPFNANTTIYFNEFRTNMTKTLQAAHAPHSVFAPACFWHCSTESDQFWQISINNQVSDQIALHSWFFEGSSNDWIDSCQGFSCTPGCPPNPE